jgi:hypothetical protein
MRSIFVFSFLSFLLPLNAEKTYAQTSGNKAKDRKNLIANKIPGYTHKKIEGFDVLINDEVLKHNDDDEYKRKPLDVLELELGTVCRVLPKKVETALQNLLIWVEWYDTEDKDIDMAVAKYYGVYGNLASWSLSQKKHPGKANNVEIINMKSVTKEHQPDVKLERCILLHEFAHAVHAQVVGSNDTVVRNVYQSAMQRRLYEETKDVYDQKKTPYARVNDHEYFAELTCCYINKLHYYPFNRDDLKKHDPDGYKLMELVWGKADKLDATIKAEDEKAAKAKLSTAKSMLNEKKKDDAIKILTKITNDFPKTSAAAEAKKLLEKN